MAQTILVVGATGQVGGEVVRLLSAGGSLVRAMVRDRAKAGAIALPNVEIVEGDLDQARSLIPVVNGVDRVFLASGGDPRQTEQQANLIDAAKRAGVSHFVKVSTVGAAVDSAVSFFRWHAETERHLANSGLPYTILQPNFFMQNVFGYAPTIRSEGRFYGCAKDGKAAMIDTRDVAAAAAATLTGKGHDGRTYLISGPEALSLAEVGAKLSTALGRLIAYVDVPAQAYEQALTAAGLPGWQVQGYVELQEFIGRGEAAAVNDSVQRIGNRAPKTFDAFAKEFAPAFAPA